MEYKFLNKINAPDDLNALSPAELNLLCGEIRDFLINSVSKTGGHLASNLGVVELTVAMHYVFDCPNDKFIFDVGHQCYTHKLLTGRRDRFDTLRKKGGISGFPKPQESKYDAFIAGHASTSIAAAYGIAEAMQLQGKDDYAVALIGDGAFTGGEAYEALNNAGRSKAKLIVILNHNDMSISKNVGAFARYLSNIRSGRAYLKLKAAVKSVLTHTPLIGKPMLSWLENSKSMIKTILYRSTFFEELGFSYFGPIDGHDIKQLIAVLNNAKNSDRPVVIQTETKKGKGYLFAEENPGAYHAISGFDVLNGGDDVTMSDCYSNTVGKIISELADADNRICAITAAMKYGTGLHYFSSAHHDRYFDVGIAEGYAVTFAGGLASQEMIPAFCVYSSFLQRGYDQLLHDIAIDRRHVVICCDRAGIVGADGETHQGIFDIAFLSSVPNVKIYSPDGYEETRLCLNEAFKRDDGLVAVRYPRGGDTRNYSLPTSINYTFCDNGGVLLAFYGRISANCFAAAKQLEGEGIKVSLLKLTRVKPIDAEAVLSAAGFKKIFFVEEAIKTGSVGEQLLELLVNVGFHGDFRLRAINEFVKQSSVDEAFADLGLDSGSIAEFIKEKTTKED